MACAWVNEITHFPYASNCSGSEPVGGVNSGSDLGGGALAANGPVSGFGGLGGAGLGGVEVESASAVFGWV